MGVCSCNHGRRSGFRNKHNEEGKEKQQLKKSNRIETLRGAVIPCRKNFLHDQRFLLTIASQPFAAFGTLFSTSEQTCWRHAPHRPEVVPDVRTPDALLPARGRGLCGEVSASRHCADRRGRRIYDGHDNPAVMGSVQKKSQGRDDHERRKCHQPGGRPLINQLDWENYRFALPPPPFARKTAISGGLSQTFLFANRSWNNTLSAPTTPSAYCLAKRGLSHNQGPFYSSKQK